ncbi:EF-hand domain-containing protein [Bordetella parapertussis]|uniref:Exported protein n=7 Tax=Bordetella TaxID=517 RepID=K0MA57_BORPB|nr:MULTISPECIES: EF-hand domain-containing protein [Bordetella]KAK66217.1 EF-hand domain pair [Bordetella bronchiseptica 980-2]KCV34885.1 EF-hand domain pair [Bordetella bronchiseptica 00-P-2730]KDD61260.1 EF-hand domain pair [Bordetella bronchiseptica OSU553]SHR54864.1 EF hand [Mycobacteroides abscessus subsp. abscessus]AMG87697.1 EF-hand domain-containing protein [Bordetella bronchiseptica]
MKKTIIASAACAALLATSGAVLAQSGASLTPDQLQHLDTDKSGGVSQKEYQAFMEASFAKLDANGDGSLTRQELPQEVSDAQFTAMDANKDGRVSRQEFLGQVMRDFATASRGGELK